MSASWLNQYTKNENPNVFLPGSIVGPGTIPGGGLQTSEKQLNQLMNMNDGQWTKSTGTYSINCKLLNQLCSFAAKKPASYTVSIYDPKYPKYFQGQYIAMNNQSYLVSNVDCNGTGKNTEVGFLNNDLIVFEENLVNQICNSNICKDDKNMQGTYPMHSPNYKSFIGFPIDTHYRHPYDPCIVKHQS